MQILPADPTGSGLDFLSGMSGFSVADASSGFAQAMLNAMDSVKDEQNVSVNAALQGDSSQDRPLVESPYSRHTTDGVTYALDEVCFTKQELRELREQLVKAGAPEESLKQFDVLASQPDGATLAQVMASLMGRGPAAGVSDEDARAITALLGKIDPSGDLSVTVLQRMGEGKGEEALALISNAFAKLAPDESIEISRDDALALGRGLGLNKNSLQSLPENFGGYAALRVTGEQFGNLMAPASTQFIVDKANRQKLDAALEQTLKPIIGKARDRMEKEKAASALRDRKAQQSRVMINKTVQKNIREILNQTLHSGQQDNIPEDGGIAAQSDAISRKLDGRQSGAVGDAGGSQNQKNPAGSLADKLNRAAANTDKADNTVMETVPGAATKHTDAKEGGKNGSSAHGFENNSGQSKDKEWNGLPGKVETQTTPPQTTNANSIVFSMLQGGQNLSETSHEQDNAVQNRHLAAQMARQVENGLLSALKDGGSRLDLQLHPQELGAITLTLTARNGEVSARIRSEKSETAEMVSRQLDSIRANLEQQGIKVDKIEVQIQNQQDDDGRQWQNLDQHNSRQEENARREELARIKNLATLRNFERNSDSDILEQPVHSPGQTARDAAQSLHVVA
ncbi:flagellar hook-length control protein FliK [uncultured Desulfovibrio sp.]|uniref:flagellar hook-length control protein FliK n=1 Tax=uncultured Desulfovibrio sp. TaxID=167968 RepID=UPI002639A425|nr:flagellar hook-length control protein FliK [uncultured Desulfovibrio sp.]